MVFAIFFPSFSIHKCPLPPYYSSLFSLHFSYLVDILKIFLSSRKKFIFFLERSIFFDLLKYPYPHALFRCIWTYHPNISTQCTKAHPAWTIGCHQRGRQSVQPAKKGCRQPGRWGKTDGVSSSDHSVLRPQLLWQVPKLWGRHEDWKEGVLHPHSERYLLGCSMADMVWNRACGMVLEWVVS